MSSYKPLVSHMRFEQLERIALVLGEIVKNDHILLDLSVEAQDALVIALTPRPFSYGPAALLSEQLRSRAHRLPFGHQDASLFCHIHTLAEMTGGEKQAWEILMIIAKRSLNAVASSASIGSIPTFERRWPFSAYAYEERLDTLMVNMVRNLEHDGKLKDPWAYRENLGLAGDPLQIAQHAKLSELCPRATQLLQDIAQSRTALKIAYKVGPANALPPELSYMLFKALLGCHGIPPNFLDLWAVRKPTLPKCPSRGHNAQGKGHGSFSTCANATETLWWRRERVWVHFHAHKNAADAQLMCLDSKCDGHHRLEGSTEKSGRYWIPKERVLAAMSDSTRVTIRDSWAASPEAPRTSAN